MSIAQEVLTALVLGTTHITNAAYRMHPMEWAIGEASG
ncbi:MAG: FAD-dependent oxidoreductase, partial [Cyanobacteria bacterium J06639_14]